MATTTSTEHTPTISMVPDGCRAGCNGSPKAKRPQFNWKVEDGAASNYRRLGQRLATSGDLYRDRNDGHALVAVRQDGKPRFIRKGSELAPTIVDRIKMTVTKDGKTVRELPTTSHLNAMLQSEMFLRHFPPVDEVTTRPFHLDDFSLARPGYHDGGPGQRVLYIGAAPTVADSTDTVRKFLDVMA